MLFLPVVLPPFDHFLLYFFLPGIIIGFLLWFANNSFHPALAVPFLHLIFELLHFWIFLDRYECLLLFVKFVYFHLDAFYFLFCSDEVGHAVDLQVFRGSTAFILKLAALAAEDNPFFWSYGNFWWSYLLGFGLDAVFHCALRRLLDACSHSDCTNFLLYSINFIIFI